MYIEDLISLLNTVSYLKNLKDTQTTQSLVDQLNKNVGFTEKQRSLSLFLIKKYKMYITEYAKQDISKFLSNPEFKHPVRIISATTAINLVERPTGKYLTSKFPYNQELINKIQQYRVSTPDSVSWNMDEKTWDFSYTETNLLFLVGLLGEDALVDAETRNVLSEIKEIIDNADKYIPLVTYDGKYHYKNAHRLIPQPESDNLAEVLIQARRYGITCYDESIEPLMTQLNPVTAAFINNSVTKPTELALPSTASLADLEDIIRFNNKILVMIPGGTELSCLEKSVKFFKNIGYSTSQMSSLFRVDSSYGITCNNFIKDNGLNNKLTDEIKFVFISGRLQKTALEFDYDVVLNFGSNSAHYQLLRYIKQHHNVVKLFIN